MNRTFVIALALSVTLAACAGQPRRDIPGQLTYLQDGSAGYAITCNGPFSASADCLTRAGQICQETGYTIVSRNDKGLLGDTALQINRDMIIRCNTADGLYPADEPRQR